MTNMQNEDLQQLLTSLDDLDAEFEAGDLEPEDYEALRNDYTVRVADAVRASGQAEAGTEGARQRSSSETAESPAAVGGSGRRLVIVATLLLFAIGAGWLLARSAGERGIGDVLTGGIDVSARQRVVDCQELGSTQGLLLEAIQCFDDVLIDNPDNVEALSYRAWFLVLASNAGSEVTDERQTELLDAAAVYLDQAISIDADYPDAKAFRAIVADRQGQPDAVCQQIADLTAVDPPAFFFDLVQPIADRNSC